MSSIFKLRKIFFILLALDFLLTASSPLLINCSFLGLSEEIIETIVLIILLSLAYVVIFLYFRELRRLRRYQVNLEDRLQDTFKYIGSVNLQMEEMRQAFANFKKYPENKKDIRTVFVYFSEKILAMVNADWVVLRIIDVKTGRSIRDDKFVRQNQKIATVKFDNNDILSGKIKLENGVVIKSDQENFNIKACCILPSSLNRDQEFFVRSMINQLEMLFIVFSSLNKSRRAKSKENNKKV
jgi:hypothetical protein